MNHAQPGILPPVPAVGRYVFFSLAHREGARDALARLAPLADGATVVVALGPSLVAAVGAAVPGLREFPAMAGPGVEVPSTPTALLCWLRGSDRGDLVLKTRLLEKALAPAFHLDRAIEAFRHGPVDSDHGRDLTGYEDGTENPEGEAAEAAAFVQAGGPGLDGSSFVAVQQWVHDFDAFERMSPAEQDNAIGRRRSDNEELEDAPEASHVKRTAQESFDPEAFVLRRSMPWAMGSRAGLLFVAFGKSLDAFEAQMRRMAGQDDGIVDALFGFSRPLSGAYFWCPPMLGGRLDLRQLGL
ncbi:Dyp-type peroxidase [Variovorax terrae]|uniref:Dyp-type peroxidase n=1 Tax=Variovorax terrae TaxID=2923278 RepID=A0A9X1VWT1_9BURK|nr:Dyp-type peroxidase [Variovorax terrae]MCJ0764695.1 Dyp-type peroxidase [Variovorax terrae]